MKPLIDGIRAILPHKDHTHPALPWIFVANLLFAFQIALPAYVYSSYLSRFIDIELVGLIFMMGAALSIAAFVLTSQILNRIGNYRFALILATLQIFAFLLLAIDPHPILAIGAFVLTQVAMQLILFSLDIFLESYTKREGVTGSVRGFFLTIATVAWMLAPLITGLLMKNEAYWLVFFVTTLFMVPFTILIGLVTHEFPDQRYKSFTFVGTIPCIWKRKNLRLIFAAQLLLQIAFTWNAIYAPLLLVQIIGFSWTEFGMIMTIALSAFLFFELPAGWIADNFWGEKEMLIGGLLIMMLTSLIVPLMVGITAVLLWALLMFINRIGAALVEVTTESYFFKHVNDSDSNIISTFRMMRPLSLIIGPIIASVCLLFMPLAATYVVLAVFLGIGAVMLLPLVDTR